MSLLRVARQVSRKRAGIHNITRAQRKNIEVPIRGLNTIDSYDNMKQEYAIVLDNLFPQRGKLESRKGYVIYNENLGDSNVNTLITHKSGNVEKLFGISNGKIYDASTASSNSEVRTGLNSSYWEYTSFGNSTILSSDSPSDEPLRIDRTGAIIPHGWTGTGFNAGRLRNPFGFKARLYWIEDGTSDVWYGPIQGVEGELRKIPLGLVHPAGGNVLNISSITPDAGIGGMDDLLCFYMSDGSVLVYRGSDPSVFGDWGKVGTYKTGKLVSNSHPIHYGTDSVGITTDGIVPLMEMMSSRRTSKSYRGNVSNKIASRITELSNIYGNLKGWQVLFYPEANFLIANVPVNQDFHQYVMNTQTKAWCRFTGIPAQNWVVYQDKLYFGGPNGTIYEANSGNSDNRQFININLQTAFHYYGTSQDKIMERVKFFFESSGAASVGLGVSTDFASQNLDPLEAISAVESPRLRWEDLTWENWTWGDPTVTVANWKEISGQGSAISIRAAIDIRDIDISFYSFDVMYKVIQSIS